MVKRYVLFISFILSDLHSFFAFSLIHHQFHSEGITTFRVPASKRCSVVVHYRLDDDNKWNLHRRDNVLIHYGQVQEAQKLQPKTPPAFHQ